MKQKYTSRLRQSQSARSPITKKLYGNFDCKIFCAHIRSVFFFFSILSLSSNERRRAEVRDRSMLTHFCAIGLFSCRRTSAGSVAIRTTGGKIEEKVLATESEGERVTFTYS